jgi:O-phospho-L-seryl-tRNASec:L-selenocysteinyl-tRNA synthase
LAARRFEFALADARVCACVCRSVHVIRRAGRIAEVGASNVLCVLTTTSCFAPRGVDKLLEVARHCAEIDVPHITNNAYGVQCKLCMKAISAASRHGRLDGYIQSTDKNVSVPGGPTPP